MSEDSAVEDFEDILTGSALTGLVIILAFAGCLLVLVAIEAVPIAMEWTQRRRQAEENRAATKAAELEHVPDANTVNL